VSELGHNPFARYYIWHETDDSLVLTGDSTPPWDPLSVCVAAVSCTWEQAKQLYQFLYFLWEVPVFPQT
jgi:hypothetical protein